MVEIMSGASAGRVDPSDENRVEPTTAWALWFFVRPARRPNHQNPRPHRRLMPPDCIYSDGRLGRRLHGRSAVARGDAVTSILHVDKG
jgi:hypothetical protein